MGNEAIARGAIEAGVQVAASYPGTPASEIMETLVEAARELGFHAEWSVNEKVAFEVAAGAALVGRRGFCSMKNAGVNWCMDMLCTITYGGVRGGLVIAVADDPGARTSSNAQDLRFACLSAEIPCFEPCDQQEAKEMTREAFEISERLELPVMVRSVARVSHSLGDVTFKEIKKEKRKAVFNKHWKIPFRWNVYGPPSTHSKHIWLHSRMPLIERIVEETEFNSITIGEDAEFGIIASGIAAAHARESLSRLGLVDKVSFLKIGTPYPIPEKKTAELLRHAKKVAVLEEGEPFVEHQVRSLAKDVAPSAEIYGKYKGRLLPIGELSPNIVDDAIAMFLGIPQKSPDAERRKIKEEMLGLIAPRSSTFCAGCPHMGTWWAIRMSIMNRKIGGEVPIINGDIGCYELAGYGLFAKNLVANFAEESVRYKVDNPYELIDTNYIMGGGIGLSQGMWHAEYRDGSILAVAGDSTFFHACIPALINAVYNKARLTFVIMDNGWTAMTGHQPHPGTGKTAMGDPAKPIMIEDICKACGVDFVRVVDPYNLKETTDAITEALQHPSVAVVITRRVCAYQWLREMRKQRVTIIPFAIDHDKCIGCRLCIQLGCPAITFDEEKKKAGIDPLLCIGCGMCQQICGPKAISRTTGG
jgi:indolepyruvate ferredoxin oxidoreductase alpha subunit